MDDVVRDLSVLSEPLRIRLLAVLATDELGVGELCRVLQLPQSTVSRHLKALRVAGWIRRRAAGTASLYGVDPAGMNEPLWDVVGAAFRATPQHTEDRARLAAVLASRPDGTSFFGRMHAEWDDLRRALFGDTFLLPAIAALLPETWTVADLGCGTGPALEILATAAHHVIGVDREPNMLAAAAQRTAAFDNVSLRQGGLEALPLEDGEVDAVTCILVLHHVPDPGRAMAEVRRVLKPGGRLALVDMVAHDRASWKQTMGHQHLGFSKADVMRHAEGGGLRVATWRALPPAPEAQGPSLFVAVLVR